jgi:hypothetical protein
MESTPVPAEHRNAPTGDGILPVAVECNDACTGIESTPVPAEHRNASSGDGIRPVPVERCNASTGDRIDADTR